MSSLNSSRRNVQPKHHLRLRRRAPSTSSSASRLNQLATILIAVLIIVVVITVTGDVLYVEEVITDEKPWLPYEAPLDPLRKEMESYPEHKESIVMSGLFLGGSGSLDSLAKQEMIVLMNTTVSYVQDHTLVLFEADSKDSSTTLMDLCDNEYNHAVCINVHFKNRLAHFFQATTTNEEKNEPNSSFKSEFRQLSWYRNMVLDRVKRMSSDYFVWCDTNLMFHEPRYPSKDVVSNEFSQHELGKVPNFGGTTHAWKPPSVIRAIHRANQQEPDWTVLCFYSTFSERSSLYDVSSFRLSHQTPIPDLAKRYQATWTRERWNAHLAGGAVDTLSDLDVTMLLFNYDKETRLVSVKSCFGGLVIYKLDKLQESACEYNEDTAESEHVSLHECLFERYPDTIFMDPQSRVYYDDFATRD